MFLDFLYCIFFFFSSSHSSFLFPLFSISFLSAGNCWFMRYLCYLVTSLPWFILLTMTTDCPVNLASFNCRGFNVPEKRSQILYHFHKMRSNILLLQEAHFSTGSIPALLDQYYQTWFHSSYPHAKSKGVSIAFHKSIDPEVLDSLIEEAGHLIFLKLKLNNFLFTVANIHNLNQARFLSSTLTRLSSFGGPCIIISGDLNTTLSPSADTSSGKSSVPISSLAYIKSLPHPHIWWLFSAFNTLQRGITAIIQ